GQIVAVAQQEFKQLFPQPGWVEHDPMEIWESQLNTLKEVLDKATIKPEQIAAIGITNQRETTIVWDRKTGKPVCNAIVWQDRRTADICNALKKENLDEYVQQTTGLVIDAYFSGTKIKWILDQHPSIRAKAESGDVIFGTVDSWLIYKLTGGSVHATDYSNASRTMLYDIHQCHWDQKLCAALRVPTTMLPEVRSSSGSFGVAHADVTGAEIPICGVAGDQQAALFGQLCHSPGMAKNTYGTGCFMLMHTGHEAVQSKNGLLTTIAWGHEGQIEYALEGSVFVAGAAIQWLRDGLGIINTSSESEALANSIKDNGDVYFVPAFTGLGTPHWDMQARGMIVGLTRGTHRAHLVRAALESIAYQTADVLKAMQQDGGIQLQALRVDGGAVSNNFLMQFQADILGVPVVRPKLTESTALGAAYLAGLGSGFWTRHELAAHWQIDRTFEPRMNNAERERLLHRWRQAVEKAKGWA
ncbi:MAG TPA: glycerol kinase GlpK, partial [Saprospiraceae bacterium]|nr:glycerol kinase GlpK [Saprospiraceae bacterium]